jgi:hypothetical protein
MKKELEESLCARYPKLFRDDFAFLCGDGWFDLIDVLCERLQFWTDKNGAPQVIFRDVKEKWGELSFSVESGNQEQWGMITMAEAMSSRVCEVCGLPGQTVMTGWRVTRCSVHALMRRNTPSVEQG